MGRIIENVVIIPVAVICFITGWLIHDTYQLVRRAETLNVKGKNEKST